MKRVLIVKKHPRPEIACVMRVYYYGVFTKLRIQRVHRTLRTFRPFSITVTFCRLGLNVRRVDFFDHGRLRPNFVSFPQC
jgi:hypothetical protein